MAACFQHGFYRPQYPTVERPGCHYLVQFSEASWRHVIYMRWKVKGNHLHPYVFRRCWGRERKNTVCVTGAFMRIYYIFCYLPKTLRRQNRGQPLELWCGLRLSLCFHLNVLESPCDIVLHRVGGSQFSNAYDTEHCDGLSKQTLMSPAALLRGLLVHFELLRCPIRTTALEVSTPLKKFTIVKT